MKFIKASLKDWIQFFTAISAILVIACLNEDEINGSYSEESPEEQEEVLLVPKAVTIYGKLLLLLILNAFCVLWILVVLLFTINLLPGTGFGYSWMSPPFWLVFTFWIPTPFCVVTIGLTQEIGSGCN